MDLVQHRQDRRLDLLQEVDHHDAKCVARQCSSVLTVNLAHLVTQYRNMSYR